MTSRHRPSPDLPASNNDEADIAESEATIAAETVLESEIERPMSERSRRRLREEQRMAEERAAREAETAVAAELAVSADAPPATIDPLTAPAPLAAVQTPSRPAAQGRQAYMLASLGAVLWIGGIASWVAYETGSGSVALDPLRIAIYSLLALAPAGLLLALAHAVRQGAALGAETRHARRMAEALVAPTALAARQTGDVLASLRGDIDQAALAAERARNDMTLLREALSDETNRLNEAAEQAGRTARCLSEQLGRERDQMQTLGVQLDNQATGVLDAVERQSRMVVDASDLAQTQLREAEAALAARAADLAASANEAQEAARVAADDLARQTLRIETAGAGVTEQIQSVEEGLGQQRAALVTAAYALRTDQEDFSAQIESQRARLSEQLSATRSAATELEQSSGRGAETMKELIEAATDQFRALIDMSQREADGFDAATKTALDRFEAVAAEARDTLMEETRRALAALQATADETRTSASEAVAQAQLRADRLGESLFDMAQKADQAADNRVAGARRIVGDTVSLVEEAGERAVERLELTMERITASLARVEEAVADMDARAANLPNEAQSRVEAVRASVEQGLAALNAASAKAAEDTEALDAKFQQRVRRNYEMLTEAVRLMGVVSNEARAQNRREQDVAPDPQLRRSPLRPDPSASPQAATEVSPPRPRLRLEPTDAPPPVQAPAPVAPIDRLDWSDLVDSRSETPPPAPASAAPQTVTPAAITREAAAALAERIAQSIRNMGVDPNALLPRSRVEEAATAIAINDPARARQIVRRVAPAAVRSVSRRVMGDQILQADVENYVHFFGQDVAKRIGDEMAVQALLTSDKGRAYLLLDAAIGDLG